MESRYGPLGSGGQTLTINGVVYSLSELLVRLGLDFGDSRPIDVVTLSDGHYVVRYFDAEDQRAAQQIENVLSNFLVPFDLDFLCRAGHMYLNLHGGMSFSYTRELIAVNRGQHQVLGPFIQGLFWRDYRCCDAIFTRSALPLHQPRQDWTHTNQ